MLTILIENWIDPCIIKFDFSINFIITFPKQSFPKKHLALFSGVLGDLCFMPF